MPLTSQPFPNSLLDLPLSLLSMPTLLLNHLFILPNLVLLLSLTFYLISYLSSAIQHATSTITFRFLLSPNLHFLVISLNLLKNQEIILPLISSLISNAPLLNSISLYLYFVSLFLLL